MSGTVGVAVADLMQQLHRDSRHIGSNANVELYGEGDDVGELASCGGIRLHLHVPDAKSHLVERRKHGKSVRSWVEVVRILLLLFPLLYTSLFFRCHAATRQQEARHGERERNLRLLEATGSAAMAKFSL